MKRINYSLVLSAVVIFMAAGCSTVEPAKHVGNTPLESYKSAYVVYGKNPTIGGYVQAALAQHHLAVSIGPLKDKPENVDFFITYEDHWNWDVAVYLDTLDVKFFDNSTGQMIASGSFRNSKLVESFPNPRKKTFEVVDSIYAKQ